MPRRVSLPAADDLFRPTAPAAPPGETPAGTGEPAVRAVPEAAPEAASEAVAAAVEAGSEAPSGSRGARGRGRAAGASGRVRHDEKMTVYVTSQELLDLERTRLELRAQHGLGLDRGRLVREALDLVLADYAERGADSLLVRRLLAE